MSSFLSFRHKRHFVLSWPVSARVSGTCNQWSGYYIKDSDPSFEDKLIGKIWKDLRSTRRIQYLQCSPSVLILRWQEWWSQIGTVPSYKDSICRGDDWEVRRQGNWESSLDIQFVMPLQSGQNNLTLSYFLCLRGQYPRISTTVQDTDDIYLGYLCDNDFQNLNGGQ